MTRKALIVASVIALALGLPLLALPSVAHADPITISSLSVTVGDTTWCDTTSSCSNKLWDLGGGVTLNAGESLVLTSTGVTPFNFDTSEGKAGGCNDGAGRHCATTLAVNGGAVTLDGAGKDVLANGNVDDGSGSHNEAANWALASSTGVGTGGFGSVYFGYADNIHSDACADSPDNNCVPNNGNSGIAGIWNGTAGSSTATKFIGTGETGVGTGIAQNNDGNHCSTTQASTLCFDAGAILIYNTQLTTVPEPSTVLLVATMLVGLTAWGLRRNRKPLSIAA